MYLYNEGQVRLWPYPRANGEHTIEVLRRLRAAFPDEALTVLWDGAPYHRATAVREAARTGAPCMVGFANGWTWGCSTACWKMSPADAAGLWAAGPSPA